DLCEQHAGETIDPTPRLPPGERFDHVVDETGAAEDQDQAEADHERRRDDRERETERRAPDCAKERERKRVPYVTAARPAPEAADSPQAFGEESRRQRRQQERTVAVLDGRDQNANDRIEREERDGERHGDDASGDESIA